VPAAQADAPPSTEQRELAIERTLACPQCTDLPLDVCDQDICNDMRALIHQKVLAGESDAAIRQYFVDRYGGRVLLAPPKTSFNLLAWAFPFVALALAGFFVVAFLRVASRRPHQRSNPIATTSWQRYRSQIEQDLQDLE
jgi:cytochrome c-type biogenesis protein CcmH